MGINTCESKLPIELPIFSTIVNTAILSVQIPLVLKKDQDLDDRGNPVYDETGKPCLRCGFKIGGGIDMDPSSSPQGYPDKV